jgi:hypothetical protein
MMAIVVSARRARSPSAAMALVVVCVVVAGAVAQPQVGETPGDASIASEDDVARLYYQLEHTPDDPVGQLVAGSNTSVAIGAAWERVRRAIEPRGAAQPAVGREAAISRFLGVVEGRLGVALPAWWEQAVQTAGHREESVGVSFDFGEFPDNASRPPELHVVVPDRPGRLAVRALRNVTVEEHDDHWLIRRGDDTCRLPIRVVHETRRLVGLLSVAFSDGRCYVALFNESIGPYQLTALDTATGNVLWTTRVWTATPSGGSTGSPSNWVDIDASKDRIVVLGMMTTGVYIESFDARTGTASLRFGTNYNEWTDEQKD